MPIENRQQAFPVFNNYLSASVGLVANMRFLLVFVTILFSSDYCFSKALGASRTFFHATKRHLSHGDRWQMAGRYLPKRMSKHAQPRLDPSSFAIPRLRFQVFNVQNWFLRSLVGSKLRHNFLTKKTNIPCAAPRFCKKYATICRIALNELFMSFSPQ